MYLSKIVLSALSTFTVFSVVASGCTTKKFNQSDSFSKDSGASEVVAIRAVTPKLNTPLYSTFGSEKLERSHIPSDYHEQPICFVGVNKAGETVFQTKNPVIKGDYYEAILNGDFGSKMQRSVRIATDHYNRVVTESLKHMAEFAAQGDGTKEDDYFFMAMRDALAASGQSSSAATLLNMAFAKDEIADARSNVDVAVSNAKTFGSKLRSFREKIFVADNLNPVRLDTAMRDFVASEIEEQNRNKTVESGSSATPAQSGLRAKNSGFRKRAEFDIDLSTVIIMNTAKELKKNFASKHPDFVAKVKKTQAELKRIKQEGDERDANARLAMMIKLEEMADVIPTASEYSWILSITSSGVEKVMAWTALVDNVIEDVAAQDKTKRLMNMSNLRKTIQETATKDKKSSVNKMKKLLSGFRNQTKQSKVLDETITENETQTFVAKAKKLLKEYNGIADEKLTEINAALRKDLYVNVSDRESLATLVNPDHVMSRILNKQELATVMKGMESLQGTSGENCADLL